MTLVAIAPPEYPVELDIAYATARNFTGKPVYARAAAYLHPIAARNLVRAIELAAPLGFKLKIFDAFRPSEAQWTLWNFRPDPDFLSDPRRGSPHSRGVAVDLTLIDAKTGDIEVSADAQRNRHMLLGLMSAAGWDFYMREWWHYQLFDSKRYPVLSDSVLRAGLMAAE
jgi:zinc D-Ala-D-Ala dipeptidase